MSDNFIPLDRIVVNGLEIPANMINQDIYHDVAEGTLSVTFIGVRNLETVYRHMVQRSAVTDDITAENRLIRETLECGSAPLHSSMGDRDDEPDSAHQRAFVLDEKAQRLA